MPRPLSRSALERLGRRLVETDQPDRSDLRDLQVLLTAYEPVLAGTVETVHAAVGSVPASRLKNTATILEKLRRQGGHTLGTIQDLGGIRVVVDGGREEQDRVVKQLEMAFAHESRSPRIIDRRAHPVQGYRAVHVIVYPDAFPIEIQVRTWAQHRWAEWFERLADQYGRGIRYGEPLKDENKIAQQTVDQMLRLADEIAAAEMSDSAPPMTLVAMELLNSAIAWLRARPTDA